MPLFGLVQAPFSTLIGLFNWIIKSDKSGRQAKTIRNVAGGNFTRGFAVREFPRGLRQGGNMEALPLARSRIPPATQAKWISADPTLIDLIPNYLHYC